MKKIIVPIYLSCCTFFSAQAQVAKSIFAELGGPGLASINFDSRFTKKDDGLGGRIGIGGFKVEGASFVFLPVGVNYLLGKDNRNYFELGAGATVVFGKGEDLDPNGFTSTFGHLTLGYRMAPKEGGFSFRAFISPIFTTEGFVPYWGGLSFGYKF
jgi:hypothetical protein